VQLVSAGGRAQKSRTASAPACDVLIDALAHASRAVGATMVSVARQRAVVGAIGRLAFVCGVSMRLTQPSRRKCRSATGS